MILSPEQWRQAAAEAHRTEHPSGWSYRTDVANLVETLEHMHEQLERARAAAKTIREL